jgi:HD superfamily phosphodiesterase
MFGDLRPLELEKKFRDTYSSFKMSSADHFFVNLFLRPLKQTYSNEYGHCLRVALLSKELARIVPLEEPLILYRAAALHRVARRKVNKEPPTDKRDPSRPLREIYQHHQIRDYHEQAYWIIQNMRVYSAEGLDLNPIFERGATERDKLRILEDARLIQILNMYDAMKNKITSPAKVPDPAEIKAELIRLNLDRARLIRRLYDEGIFI